jgi:hypothetical protein
MKDFTPMQSVKIAIMIAGLSYMVWRVETIIKLMEVCFS